MAVVATQSIREVAAYTQAQAMISRPLAGPMTSSTRHDSAEMPDQEQNPINLGLLDFF